VSFLRSAGIGSTSFDLAAAFVTSAGVDSVLHLLQRVATKGNVRVLTGLYQGFTDPKALRTLLRVEQETGGTLSIRVSTVPHFHWKSYFLLKQSTAAVVIGSSNLTDDGLRKTGELNVVLTLDRKSSQFKAIHDPFEKHWRSKAKPLNAEIIASYETWRKSNGGTPRTASVPLRKILGSSPAYKPETIRERRFWCTPMDGTLSDETEAVLHETTDWDRRGLFYMSTWSPTYRSGDRVVIFDLGRSIVSVAEIVATTQTPQATPDGKHFAAYRRLQRIPQRRLIPKRWKSLKEAGLIRLKSDAHRGSRLSEKRFTAFVENLKAVVR
jgi:HKD family nuclease